MPARARLRSTPPGRKRNNLKKDFGFRMSDFGRLGRPEADLPKSEIRNPKSITRSSFLAGGAALWGAAIFGKLFYLQALKHKDYARMAREHQLIMGEIPG